MGDRKVSLDVYDLTIRRRLTVAGNTVGGDKGWLPLTDLSGQVSVGTAVVPSSKLTVDGLVVLRGLLTWSAQTIAANTVLAVLHADHRPRSIKTIEVRTSPTSNISSQLKIATNGQITNVSGFGTTTTAEMSFDSKFFDLE